MVTTANRHPRQESTSPLTKFLHWLKRRATSAANGKVSISSSGQCQAKQVALNTNNFHFYDYFCDFCHAFVKFQSMPTRTTCSFSIFFLIESCNGKYPVTENPKIKIDWSPRLFWFDSARQHNMSDTDISSMGSGRYSLGFGDYVSNATTYERNGQKPALFIQIPLEKLSSYIYTKSDDKWYCKGNLPFHRRAANVSIIRLGYSISIFRQRLQVWTISNTAE